jgi:tetratricopeptide (TPR) repeat protein
LIREVDTGMVLCFSNVEIQQVIYDSLSQLRRRRLHRHVGETLINQHSPQLETIAGQIAYHFIQADNRQNSFIYCLKAGQHAQSMHAYRTALQWYLQAAELLPEHENFRQYQIDLYQGLGKMLQIQVRYGEAADYYEKLYQVAEEQGDSEAMVQGLYQLSSVNNTRGDYQAALEAGRKTERAARAAKTRDLLAASLFEQGWALLYLGHLEEAKAMGEQALSFSKLIESKYETAQSLKLLAAVQNSMGHHQQSIDSKQQALAIYRELGQKNQVAVMLNNIGDSCRLRYDYASAMSLYQEALSIAQEIGDLDHQIWYMTNLAATQVRLGDYATAETELRTVLNMPEANRSPMLPETYRFLAEAALGQRKVDEAVAQAQLALALAEENKVPERIGQAYRTMGRVAAVLSDRLPVQDQSFSPEDCFGKSLAIFDKLGMAAESARTYESWASYAQAQGNEAQANELQQQAQAIFDQLGVRKR